MELPYGGIDWTTPDPFAEPWASLHEIQRQLERGEPLSPRLARWIGEAIKHSGDDPGELMRRMGLRNPKGRPSPHPRDAWAVWGQRVEQARASGLSPERAIDAVLDQMSASGLWDPIPDRATLQRWAKDWAEARDAHFAWWDQGIKAELAASKDEDPHHERRQRMRDLLSEWRKEADELRRLEEMDALPASLREQVEQFDRAVAAMMARFSRA